MVKEYSKFKAPGKASADFGDARKLKLKDNSVDGVITSPPYLNQIDYTKVYGIENWFVGRPRPPVRSYLGLGKENPLQAYLADMEQVLGELYRVCRPGASVGLVVGDAFLEKPVEIDLKLSNLAREIGFIPKEILVLNKRAALRARTIKVGLLRESLVVLKKSI